MIEYLYDVKPCPFCGNPPVMVDSEPFSFMPNEPTKRIRCNTIFCPAYSIDLRFYAEQLELAKTDWNTRKRKNKLIYKKQKQEGE